MLGMCWDMTVVSDVPLDGFFLGETLADMVGSQAVHSKSFFINQTVGNECA